MTQTFKIETLLSVTADKVFTSNKEFFRLMECFFSEDENFSKDAVINRIPKAGEKILEQLPCLVDVTKEIKRFFREEWSNYYAKCKKKELRRGDRFAIEVQSRVLVNILAKFDLQDEYELSY